MRRVIQFLAATACALAFLGRVAAGAQAEHIVVVVWDGMRPDFISEKHTPTLHQLARRGTFFKNHHSTYVTSTEVNGTALATGMHPSHSGILANVQYLPELNWLSSFGTESLDAIRRGDLLSDGRYLAVPTLAEILQSAGIPTLTAGAKPVVLLHDRSAVKTLPAQKDSVTLFRGQTLPRSLLASLSSNQNVGPFPADANKPESTRARVLYELRRGRDKAYTWMNGRPPIPPIARRVDDWTTRAVIHGLWQDRVPKYTLLWLSEPDSSQHATGPGSPNALVGLERADQNLALVLEALKAKGILERTDLFVVSDHGFSTIEEGPDLVKALKKAKFVAGKEFSNPDTGDIMVVTLGGSVFFYVFDHDEATIRRLVDFLQRSDFAGVIFSHPTVEGTFPLSHVNLDAGRNSPDVVVSMRWRAEENDWGTPGLVTSVTGRRGAGTHASLSPFDLHNTLIAAGPSFKAGFVNELPSGNVDLAPTILSLLGVRPPAPMDGRVLTEALVGSKAGPPQATRETFKAARDLGRRKWQQSLTLSRVGPVVYYDEGHGENSLK